MRAHLFVAPAVALFFFFFFFSFLLAGRTIITLWGFGRQSLINYASFHFTVSYVALHG
jgi:hypothetical protein